MSPTIEKNELQDLPKHNIIVIFIWVPQLIDTH